MCVCVCVCVSPALCARGAARGCYRDVQCLAVLT